ncbi:MAG: hypothetical protein HQK84_05830, partial [Nitrospinae bacterium]|nr:hypothetical protein [Nitrospinota bacterium]
MVPSKIKSLLFSLVILAISLAASYFIGKLHSFEFIILILYSIFVVFITVGFSLYSMKSRYKEETNEMIEKMKDVVKLAQEKIVINTKILRYIEQDAEEVWIVTKTLKNDTEDKDIRESVMDNLKKGKQYIYFVPDS